MRIGIDARELGGRVTGVGRYLAGLLAEWSAGEAGRRHEFVLYAHEPVRIALNGGQFSYRHVAGKPNTWWEQLRLPSSVDQDTLDVFFAPAYTAPVRLRVPVVVTIHDLSYVAHPEWFRAREGFRRRWLTARTARAAQAVITVSEFSKREIVERLGTPADRIHVIPQGIAPATVHASAHPDPRVLYVGSIFNRRRIPDLLTAIERLARHRPDVSLDIVGDNRTFPFEDLDALVARPTLKGRARWHRYASDAELAALYSEARAFAFVSEYEGLGTTPLEALTAGVPSVVADTAVSREAYGAAALYVPVGQPERLADALEQLLFDDSARASVLSAAPQTLARFDWARAARQTLAVLEAARRR